MNKSIDAEALKIWIRRAISGQIQDAQNQTNAEIKNINLKLDNLQKFVASEMSKLRKNTENLHSVTVKLQEDINEVTDSTPQALTTTNQQLTLVSQELRDLVVFSAKKTEEKVYKRVIDEINNELAPKVNNVIEWVHWQTEDGSEAVNKYRMAVEKQANPHFSGKYITDGGASKQFISDHVRTFFSDDESDNE